MKVVNVLEAKTHLSRLLAQVAEGETFVIGKAGVPLAVLCKWQADASERKGGGWQGKAWIAADFDAPDAEVEALFSGTAPLHAWSHQRVAEEPAP